MKNILKQRKRHKKVALFTPYLDVLGGGELHVLYILKALEDFGFFPFVFWEIDLRDKIEEKFGLSFKKLAFLPNIFKKRSFFRNAFFLKNFDIFIYVPDGSYFFSFAKKNFLFCMVPKKELYKGVIRKIKLFNWQIVANSKFTAKYVSRVLSKKVKVLYPPLGKDILNLNVNFEEKEDLILNIGRFFKQLHSKKQDILINLFKKIKHKNQLIKKFRLILIGSLKEEDKNFLISVKKLIRDDEDIELKLNLKRKEVLKYLKKAKYYWHFTGFGETEPFKMEHLGISILEAMAAGCIVFAYNQGGPKELIKDKETGFLFNNLEEFEKKFLDIVKNKIVQRHISEKALSFARKNFSHEKFKSKVKKLFL